MAAALARAGRMVFIPELDLYSERFTEADLERFVVSVEGLHALPGRPITVVGFSFGGSFALVASAEERMEGKLSRIATFGAYFRLEGLIQAISTGVSVVDGRVIPSEGHPLAKEVLTAHTVEQLPAEQRDPVLAALDGRVDPDELAEEGRALYELWPTTIRSASTSCPNGSPGGFRRCWPISRRTGWTISSMSRCWPCIPPTTR